MGTEDIRPNPERVDASGDFPVSDRSVSEERQRIEPPKPSKPGEEIVVLSPPLQIGQLIAGKYRLKRTIGEGGMGLVWIALNEDLDVDVAVKVLRPESRKSARTQVAERMLVEARSAARLGHPAIVRVLDLGRTDDGDPFLVMELLEGENLADVVETRGPMDAVEAVKTLLPIAHAMVAAHEKNIIHRDLKPENIILSVQQGGAIQPKLIDFGVAKLSTESADRITQMGMLVGSPGYMSPEQGRGDAVDARSDVWSFCIVLHELVTGNVPFRKNHPYAILRAILEDPLPDLEAAGFRDDALAAIVRRGLEKEAEDRWQSMHELGVTLARWLLDKGEFDDICGASLDVTWLRARMSLPEGLATFRERSPSLSALARMRDTTRETPEPTEPIRIIGSEVPVALGPVFSSTPPPQKKTALWIAVGALAISAIVVAALAYPALMGSSPASPGAALPRAAAAPTTPSLPTAEPVTTGTPEPTASAHEDAHDHARTHHTTPIETPSKKAVGAASAAPQATSTPATPPTPAAPATDTVAPSPLKRPDL